MLEDAIEQACKTWQELRKPKIFLIKLFAINRVSFISYPPIQNFINMCNDIYTCRAKACWKLHECQRFLASPRVKVDTARNKCSFDGEGEAG